MTLVNSELSLELAHYVRQDEALSMLSAEATDNLLKTFSASHGVDLRELWTWIQVAEAATTRPYSRCEDALEILEDVTPQSKAGFILVATDDELPPWIAISSLSLAPLLTMVGEHRFFEFFLTSPDANWFAFDTHHNCIVYSNAPTGAADLT